MPHHSSSGRLGRFARIPPLKRRFFTRNIAESTRWGVRVGVLARHRGARQILL